MGRKQIFPTTSIQGAQRQAKEMRKIYKELTVNVIKVGENVWGVKTSPKGKKRSRSR